MLLLQFPPLCACMNNLTLHTILENMKVMLTKSTKMSLFPLRYKIINPKGRILHDENLNGETYTSTNHLPPTNFSF